MRRARKILLWVLAVIVLLPVGLLAAILAALNTGAGQGFAAREIGALTGGTVRLAGLHGVFPQALRLRRLELTDAKGVWLSAEDVVLDWSPLALAGRSAHVRRLTAAALTMTRLPQAAPAPPAPASAARFRLPVHVVVDNFAVARLRLGRALAGQDVVLRVAGQGDVPALDRGRIDITAQRLDGAGQYRVQGALAADGAIQADIALDEPAHGLLGALAGLPDLGPLSVTARVAGPRNAEHVRADAAAGELRAHLQGSADLAARTLDMALRATAPAMQPAAGIAWRAIDLSASATGPWTAPDAKAHLAAQDVTAAGAGFAALALEAAGTRQAADLSATVTGLRIPGPKPDSLAAPLVLTAHADLAAAARRVSFQLRHALFSADGAAVLGAAPTLQAALRVPDIAPLAALGDAAAQGSLTAQIQAARHGTANALALDADLNVTGGQAPLPALLGHSIMAARLSQDGDALTVTSASLRGRAVRLSLSGSKAASLDFTWAADLNDLAALAPQARGALHATGTLRGPPNDMSAGMSLSGSAGGGAVPQGPVTATLQASGLPGAPQGDVRASATLDGGRLDLAAHAARQVDGALRASLTAARWKSLTATAQIARAAGATVPDAKIRVAIGTLGDFARLTGQNLSGGLTVAVDSASDTKISRVAVRGTDLGAAGNRMARLDVTGQVSGAEADPDIRVTVAALGIEAQGITGEAHAAAQGRAAAMGVTLSGAARGLPGGPGSLKAAAMLNARDRTARLTALSAGVPGLVAHLEAPAAIKFGSETSVDALRLAVNDATLRLAGRVSPTLDVTASLRHVTPDLAKPFLPALNAAGVLNADARLSGTPAAPSGIVHVAASGVKLRAGPAAAMPAANLRATVALQATQARLDAALDAGPKLHLSANGTAPLTAGGALAMRAQGRADLTLLDPILEAAGRRARGLVQIDMTANGAVSAPSLRGSAALSGGEVQDFAQGLHLSHMAARLSADGQVARLESFQARAGEGSLTASGTLGLAGAHPVDLRLRAVNAKPLASDLLTAVLDADLTLRGPLAGDMQAQGAVKLRRADITIPDSLPPSVVVLHVRKPGEAAQRPAAAAAPPAVVRLAIDVDAPRGIFVRGHGLDAELGGKLHVRGTSFAPDISGGFDLRRGNFSLAGTSLDFSRGEVRFDGAGLAGKIDPTLDFEADSVAGGITATLKITGYADAPKIGLSSVPDLPQDEVLSHLLFGTSVKNLSPFQIAEIGAALAEITGVTGSAGPLDSVRKGLGLDRLSVGGGTNGAGASVQAGRYVAPGVYVGARQAAGGAGGTQAQVQVDLTRRLKLQTTLGTGGGSAQGATPENDPGSSIGLAYQFEY